MMPTASAKARAAFVGRSGRWKSSTGSASAGGWWQRVAPGVPWKPGKVFVGDDLLYAFDLLPEEGHKMPAFINLQQFYLEKALVDRALEQNNLDLRWKNKLIGIAQRNDGARLTIDTPDGPYQLDTDWL